MYEFHGWAIIRESVAEADKGSLFAIVTNIKTEIEEMNWGSSVLDIKAINGSFHLYTTGLTNHKGEEAYDVVEFLRSIAKRTPGSYGIFYVRNDEEEGFENKFKVYVLSRGKLVEKEDPFLSPCIPTIEE